MSDKFFFKGRQQASQNHTNYGFQGRGKHKAGSQKHPLALVVTSDARKQEVEAQVAQANLYADITVNNSDDAVESIFELTALLNKSDTVQLDKTPSRNEPCSCGSGKKYKKCCG